MIVYVSIGNSDEKLSRQDWSLFVARVEAALEEDKDGPDGPVERTYGFWVSESRSRWQGACWCVVVRDEWSEKLQALLCDIAEEFRQDSIAWAEVKSTVYLEPMP